MRCGATQKVTSPRVAGQSVDTQRDPRLSSTQRPPMAPQSACAVKLREAGVAVSSKRYPSMVHGYISITGSIVGAREPWHDLVAGLRRAFR